MAEFLLELLSEEIPARMQRRAIEDLTRLLRDKLAAAEIPAAAVRGYVTPRRLAVIAEGIPATQPDHTEERRGPRVGAPQPAIDGFVRAAGLVSIDDCEIRDAGRGEFYFAVLHRAGRPTAEVLPDLVKSAIGELPWPKSMRWPGSSFRWVRPLNSVICLFDGAVVPLALDSVPVGRTTRGHRLLAPEEISIETAADYMEKLESAYVILDQDHRRAQIEADLQNRASDVGLVVRPDRLLLEEVTGLAELPVVLAGRIDRDFMGLPSEVLATAMRTHQKYFACQHADGSLAAHFLFVANNSGNSETIVAGNERVLRARLADARFFWDKDLKARLEDRVEALKGRVYHDKLGSVYDKVIRMEALAEHIAPFADADPVLARRAAHLAKADLSTGMVGEFPELQGIMGRYYALNSGQHARIANAIADHYKPLGLNDTCPATPESIAVALADKIDAITAFFSIGEQPTGSGDPFALRRAAQGLIRIILENRLRVPLRGCFRKAVKLINVSADESIVVDPTEPLIDFVFNRLRVHVREQGISRDLIDAARRPGVVERGPSHRALLHEDDLTRFMRRISALNEFLVSDDGTNLLTAYRRAANIVAIEERRDGPHDGPPNRQHFESPVERSLEQSLRQAGQDAADLLQRENFEAAMAALARLRRPVDEFFDKVTVNTDEPTLRENRLRLLSRIRATMNLIADFSQIEG
jgi:glycyl-tRNA synthetase beta chain